MNPKQIFATLSIVALATIGLASVFIPTALWTLVLVAPIVLIGIVDLVQTKHAIRRNFPVVGNFRYILEGIRPEIMQYYVETDTDGAPK